MPGAILHAEVLEVNKTDPKKTTKKKSSALMKLTFYCGIHIINKEEKKILSCIEENCQTFSKREFQREKAALGKIGMSRFGPGSEALEECNWILH